MSSEELLRKTNAGLNLPDRRAFLYGLGASLGSVALSALLNADSFGQSSEQPTGSPLAAKPRQVPAKAKSCILLFMEGGPSHIDTFDPKPKLDSLHLQEFIRQGEKRSAMESGKRYYVQSPFKFRKAGSCGADMCVPWQHLAGVADDLCFFRGCQAESVNHPTAMYHMNTGNRFGGDPAVGAWVTYGLGSENQDLPGFIVLPELAYPQGGAANWGNGFLPAHFQGTALRAAGSPILDLRPPAGIDAEHQRANLDLLAEMNGRHAAQHVWHKELSTRLENYELAFRMQMQVPKILDIDKEDEATKAMYGVGMEPTDKFARKCLLARRLVERGVRFVQLFAGTWDSHDYIQRSTRYIDSGCGPADCRVDPGPETAGDVRRDADRVVRRVW